MDTPNPNNLPMLPLDQPETWQDLHSAFAAARTEAGFALGPDGSMMAIGLEEVEFVLKDPRFGGASLTEMFGITEGPLAEWWPMLMFSKSGSEHTRVRQLVSRVFTPRRVEGLRPTIAAAADELLAPALESGSLAVIEDFAKHLPIRSIIDTLGMPQDAAKDLRDWASALDLTFSFGPGDNSEMISTIEDALGHLNEFIRQEIADRRATPREDLTTALIEARDEDARLSEDELIALIGNLIWAGAGTTVRQLAIATALVAIHPAVADELRRDEELLPTAVEEMIRYEPTVLSSARVPLEDIEFNGVQLPAGIPVGTNLVSAARDERVFDEPHRFDIRRKNDRPIGFGAGIHYCVGAALARVTLQEGVRSLLRGASSIEIDEPVRWSEFLNLRDPGPVSLRLTR